MTKSIARRKGPVFNRSIMKKIFLLLVFLTALLTSLLTGCASSTDPADAYKNESQQQIYQAGKTALRSGDYSEAIKRFEALDVQYPYGSYTEQAQLYLIYAYYMKEDYALSVAAANRFIRTHPTNPHVDYAYYIRGLADYYQNLGFLEHLFSIDVANRDLAQMQKSYTDFNELYTRFPNSPYAPSAHQFMAYLRNMMARHELNVAEYYYERKAYMASANRASGLVAHYQGAPSVIDGLALMTKSYHQLGATKLEHDSMAVLQYNYPNTRVDLNESSVVS